MNHLQETITQLPVWSLSKTNKLKMLPYLLMIEVKEVPVLKKDNLNLWFIEDSLVMMEEVLENHSMKEILMEVDLELQLSILSHSSIEKNNQTSTDHYNLVLMLNQLFTVLLLVDKLSSLLNLNSSLTILFFLNYKPPAVLFLKSMSNLGMTVKENI